jgi:hypothetical protein
MALANPLSQESSTALIDAEVVPGAASGAYFAALEVDLGFRLPGTALIQVLDVGRDDVGALEVVQAVGMIVVQMG